MGVGLNHSSINQWSSWGPLPMGWDWRYFNLPYVTISYRWLTKYDGSIDGISKPFKLNPVMLNVGVNGGIGGMLSFLPVPFAVNGSAGLSTDFNQLYARGRVGWDIFGFSIGAGYYFSLTHRKTEYNSPSYMFLEINYTFLRNNFQQNVW